MPRLLASLVQAAALPAPPATPLSPGSPGSVTGELRHWHKVTLTLDGPFARERDTRPNPFLDYRLTVRFAHESGAPVYDVPGYFAADGAAGETSAEEGAKWRAHLSPDRAGRWTWRASFVKGERAAVDPKASVEAVPGVDAATGSFTVLPTDRMGRDFRAHGRLQCAGTRGNLRLLAAAERPPVRELAEPRALVGLRAGGPRLLPQRAHPVPGRGGPLQSGSLREVAGGTSVSVGTPPSDPGDDWLAVVRRER